MHTPRPWRRLPPDLFRFATTELYDLRVGVMCVFDDSAVLQPALTFEQVRSGLAALGWDEAIDDPQLDQALGMLAGWGLLEASQNHAARYATPEEFERRNLQWSLTAQGQAAIGGVLHALDALRQVAGLQPAVIEAIADGLADLHDLAGDPSTDAGRIATRLAEVESHLISLVTSVRQFNTQLQRLMRDDATSDEVFGEVKRRTVVYLKEYIDGVERPTRRVRAGIERLVALGVEGVLDRALAGANLAPVPGADPGVAWRAERARRWDALRAWFAPEVVAGAPDTPEAQPKIAALVGLAREAILQLLRVLERRWESRRRSASVAEDFRALAAFFALAAGEGDAHRLFNAAFGAWPARHAHLTCPDAE
ncbi:MAG TPA: TIGR02677 family protein, partial [Actinomycetota bacterium]